MNIHEYQAKEILRNFGVELLQGGVAFNVQEARKVAENLKGPVFVVKSQIHAGGRGKGTFKEEKAGKGGGVRIVKDINDVAEQAKQMLNATLVTHQSGLEGKQVKRIYIEEGCSIQRELYLSLLVDRATSRILIMASTEGGMDIEKVAHDTPEKIITHTIHPSSGVSDFHGRKIGFALGLQGDEMKSFLRLFPKLYRAFVSTDASMLEINPLVITDKGAVIPLDAKMNFDDNALFRHGDIRDMRDENEEDPMELEAHKHELNYVKLDGKIGCLVNGAGLAMATMDIIKYYGSSPANFLDVGGGATKERVTKAFKIILSDPNVKAILVNIFGGIMRCDIIAEGIIAAAKDLKITIPLVVRLEGTNVELGKEILKKSNLEIISGENLADAAQKAVNAIK